MGTSGCMRCTAWMPSGAATKQTKRRLVTPAFFEHRDRRPWPLPPVASIGSISSTLGVRDVPGGSFLIVRDGFEPSPRCDRPPKWPRAAPPCQQPEQRPPPIPQPPPAGSVPASPFVPARAPVVRLHRRLNDLRRPVGQFGASPHTTISDAISSSSARKLPMIGRVIAQLRRASVWTTGVIDDG